MLAQDFLIFEATEMKNETKARYRKAVALRQFFKYLTNNKLLFSVSPMANLELPSPKPALPKYMTLEQSIDMLKNIKTDVIKRQSFILSLIIFYNDKNPKHYIMLGI